MHRLFPIPSVATGNRHFDVQRRTPIRRHPPSDATERDVWTSRSRPPKVVGQTLERPCREVLPQRGAGVVKVDLQFLLHVVHGHDWVGSQVRETLALE